MNKQNVMMVLILKAFHTDGWVARSGHSMSYLNLLLNFGDDEDDLQFEEAFRFLDLHDFLNLQDFKNEKGELVIQPKVYLTQYGDTVSRQPPEFIAEVFKHLPEEEIKEGDLERLPTYVEIRDLPALNKWNEDKQDLLKLLVFKAMYKGKAKGGWVPIGSIIDVTPAWDLDEVREAVFSLHDCDLLQVSDWPSRAEVEAADPMVPNEGKDPELWRTSYGRLVAKLPPEVIVETFKYKRLPSEEPEVEEIHF